MRQADIASASQVSGWRESYTSATTSGGLVFLGRFGSVANHDFCRGDFVVYADPEILCLGGAMAEEKSKGTDWPGPRSKKARKMTVSQEQEESSSQEGLQKRPKEEVRWRAR